MSEKVKSISKQKQERLYRFDYMKAFLIFCVVLGHVALWFPDDGYILHCTQLWIYFFHMPAFVFLAGLFSKNIVSKNQWNRAIPYIFLYLLMKSVIYFADVYRRGSDHVTIDLFHADGVEWFALALFWWYVITIAIKKVHPVYTLIISVCLAVISGYTDTDTSFLVWQRTITFYPFFYLGYVLDADRLVKWSLVHKRIKITFAIALLILLYIVIYFFYNDLSFCLPLFRGYVSYREIFGSAKLIYGGIYRLLAYTISFVLVFALITVFPDKRIKAIAYLGSRTLPIYAFHSPMIPLLLTLSSGNLKTLMLETNLFCASIAYSVFLCIVTSLPIFNTILKRLMEIPMKD